MTAVDCKFWNWHPTPNKRLKMHRHVDFLVKTSVTSAVRQVELPVLDPSECSGNGASNRFWWQITLAQFFWKRSSGRGLLQRVLKLLIIRNILRHQKLYTRGIWFSAPRLGGCIELPFAYFWILQNYIVLKLIHPVFFCLITRGFLPTIQ